MVQCILPGCRTFRSKTAQNVRESGCGDFLSTAIRLVTVACGLLSCSGGASARAES